MALPKGGVRGLSLSYKDSLNSISRKKKWTLATRWSSFVAIGRAMRSSTLLEFFSTEFHQNHHMQSKIQWETTKWESLWKWKSIYKRSYLQNTWYGYKLDNPNKRGDKK
jgi:hypothetical protein